jgi:CRP-like cAMP-binding protein
MAISREPLMIGDNKLLAALPRKDRERLAPLLEPVSLAFGQVLYESAATIRYVYFPTGGIISLLLLLEDGSVAEVARVGNEGMIGLPLFLGVSSSHTRAFVQIPGVALRMKARVFRQQAALAGPLNELLLRYGQTLLGYSQRLTACNTWHTVEQRLCRWLLITLDRVQTDQIEVTQEFLSQMLGVHRQSVTVAASNLQNQGLIRYSRGKLRLLDRHGLEGAACECYRAIQRQFDQLLTGSDG